MPKSDKPKICLNMIVRDEEHVVKETLECMSKYIDYYVISDTGSVDNTKKVIKEFFDEKGIAGEIHDDVWEDFGHNRTLALQECVGKSEYIWVIDADDIIIGDLVLPKKMTADCYLLKYGKGFTYKRLQIFKNDPKFDWKYVGVLHEYPTTAISKKEEFIDGNYHVDSRRLGARSQTKDKYLKDALIFEKDLEKNPDNERSVFYMAQSYYDHGDIEKAIDVYKRRIEMGRWYEEVFYSYYRIATGKETLGFPWSEVEKAYLDAWNYCKKRAEPIYSLAKHYRLEKDWPNSYKWAKLGYKIPYPKDCSLFVYSEIYDFKIGDELSISAYYTGNYQESYTVAKRLLDENKVPKSELERVNMTLKFAEEKLDKSKVCIIFAQNGVDSACADIIESVKLTYKPVIICDSAPKDDTYTILTMDQYKKYNFDQSLVVVYGPINILLSQNKFTSNVILIQNRTSPYICTDKGYIVNIDNPHILSTVASKITKIISLKTNKLRYDSDSFIKLDNFKHIDFSEYGGNNLGKVNLTIKDFDATHNGFNYIIPKFIQEISVKNGSEDLELKFYEDMVNYFNNSAESLSYVAKYHFDKNNYEKAITVYNNCITSLKGRKENFRLFENMLNSWIAACYSKLGRFKESFELADKILRQDRIPEKNRWDVENIRDKNIDFIKDGYLVYPAKKVIKIVENKNKNENRIMFSITSCKRFDLFEKTVNSFINCCEDIQMVDEWLCVDDNSSEEDRKKMKKLYPFFTFIFKTPEQKGHCISMNMIRDYSKDFDYLLHMEDDFHFVEKRGFLGQSIKIFKHDDNIGQVLFNKNYAEVEPYKIRIGGGILKKINNLRYYIHEHYISGTPEYDKFMDRASEGRFQTCAYWPHFSFRPSLLRCSMLQDVGTFYPTPHFEMAYADEYVERGYVSAFLDTFSCIHIGKKTWEKNGINSYDLNRTDQFTIKENIMDINILSKDIDQWKKCKQELGTKLYPLKRVTNKKMDNIPDRYKQMFIGNSFNYRRDILSNIVDQLDRIKDCSDDYLVVLDENCTTDDIDTNKIIELIGNNDCLFFKDVGFVLTRDGCEKIKDNLDKINNITNPFLDSLEDMCNNIGLKTVYSDLIKPILNDNLEPTPFKQFDRYTFYSQLDSFGDDIKYYENKTVEELKHLADADPNCVAFNTSGWLKHTVKEEKDLIYLWDSVRIDEGLYIKI